MPTLSARLTRSSHHRLAGVMKRGPVVVSVDQQVDVRDYHPAPGPAKVLGFNLVIELIELQWVNAPSEPAPDLEQLGIQEPGLPLSRAISPAQRIVYHLLERLVEQPCQFLQGVGYVIIQRKCCSHQSIMSQKHHDVNMTSLPGRAIAS